MAEKGDSGRIGVTVIGAVVSVPASYVVQRVLGAWGVLDAISDAAGKYLKAHVPPAAAGWTIALIFVLGFYGLLLWKMWRPHRIPQHVLDQANQAAANFWIRPSQRERETSPESFRKNELAEKRARSRQAHDWMPLHAALRYLVYQSVWADAQPAVTDEAAFDRVVASEVRERLARGDIAARGKLGIDDNALQRATEPIPAEFWVNAFLQPHGEIALADDNRSIASTPGGGGPAYRSVIVRQSDVRTVWRPRRATDLTPLARCVENLRAEIEAEVARPRQGLPGMGGVPFPPSNNEPQKATTKKPARKKADSPHVARALAAIQAMDDDLKEGEKRAADLLSSMVPPSKVSRS